MSLTVAIIVLLVLAIALIALLGATMAWPRHLRRHRPAGRRAVPRNLRVPRSDER